MLERDFGNVGESVLRMRKMEWSSRETNSLITGEMKDSKVNEKEYRRERDR